MAALIAGVQIGLALAILVGPLLFALIQASLEKGSRAGFAVGVGIWSSDLLFILTVYFGLQQINHLVNTPLFIQWISYAGSLILMVVGLSLILAKKSPKTQNQVILPKTYGALFLQGFLINTINPFTFFFWLGLITTSIVGANYSTNHQVIFFSAIMGTVIFTDIIKILLASRIRKRLQFRHILLLRKISGGLLIAFGIGILLKLHWPF